MKLIRTCPECGVQFTPRRSIDRYCETTCSRAADQRELKRARVLYRALYWWRLDRRTCAENLRFICREVRDWILEDRAAGRLPPPRHDHSRDRGHELRPARVAPGEPLTGTFGEAGERSALQASLGEDQ